MAGSIERRLRDIAWSLVRERPNVSLFNGKGCGSLPPRSRYFSRILILLFSAALLAAGTFTVTGQYLDKKGNSIASTIGYTGIIKDKKGNTPQENINIEWTNQEKTTTMNEQGEFTIETIITNIKDHELTKNYELKQNYPNPFNPSTNIEIQTTEPGKITIHDILGRTINEINIPTPGQHTIKWGGTNKQGKTVASGTYIYKLTTNKHTQTKKMTVLEGGNTGLEIIKTNNQTLKKQANTATDTLKIKGENITNKEKHYKRTTGTTNIGTITINTGPRIIKEIPTQNTYTEDTLRINLNNHFYNDEQGLYLLSTYKNFEIEQDTIPVSYTHLTLPTKRIV